ncbi:MAG: hypothetical protein IJM44_01815 [Ruminococcus sp.]|nr:hypothetical protein [Ruminococcus sp.]
MKLRYIAISMLTAALAGCAENNVSSSVNVPETTETTAAQVTTEAQETTEPETTELPHGVLDYEVTDGGILLNMDGAEVQTVSTETLPEFRSPVVADYDFDGYEDIFVPDKDICSGMGGDYWLYDPESGKFGISDALALVDGRGWTMTVCGEGQLQLDMSSRYGSTSTVYEWSGDVLVPVGFVDKYRDDDYNGVEDEYEYGSDGQRYMVCRTCYDTGSGDILRTETDPRYFRVTETSIDVMKGREVLQSIENDTLLQLVDGLREYVRSHPETTAHHEFDVMPPEHYLRFEDYDYDGFDDLAVPTEFPQTGEWNSFFYYRFDPDTELYVPWDTLNEKGVTFYFPPDNCTDLQITGYTGLWNDETYEYYVYVWRDGELVPTLHTHYYTADDGFRAVDKYVYDENGDEVYDGTGVVIMDDFGEEDTE